jgi:hypothetical protein
VNAIEVAIAGSDLEGDAVGGGDAWGVGDYVIASVCAERFSFTLFRQQRPRETRLTPFGPVAREAELPQRHLSVGHAVDPSRVVGFAGNIDRESVETEIELVPPRRKAAVSGGDEGDRTG